jgi:hypothetical protein
MSRYLGIAFLVPVASFVALVGCAADDQEEIASASTTSALQSSQNGSLSHTTFALDPTGICDARQAAAAAAASPVLGMYPEGCATKTVVGARVHLQLDDCAGPFGKVHVSGGIDATFAEGKTCGYFTASFHGGPDLTANGRALKYDGTADIHVEDGKRIVALTDTAAGTTKRGRDFTRTATLSVAIDDVAGCEDIDGSAHGTIGPWEVDGTISGFHVCDGRCPTSGSLKAVKHGALADKTLTISFDGSDDAHVTGWRGRKFNVPLACEDGEAAN